MVEEILGEKEKGEFWIVRLDSLREERKREEEEKGNIGWEEEWRMSVEG